MLIKKICSMAQSCDTKCRYKNDNDIQSSAIKERKEKSQRAKSATKSTSQSSPIERKEPIMRTFSKSKLMALRQCPKRLWLEIHRQDLREDSAATQTSFQVGHQVGDIAQRIYDPEGCGALIDIEAEGFNRVFERSAELLQSSQPVFEAGFRAGGVLAFADVMLPIQKDDAMVWRMVEVKSSTSVKNYHRDDVAVQSFVAHTAGVPLEAIALAHIDSSWVYPGNEDYRGLLKENDLTSEAFSRAEEVKAWITQAQAIDAEPIEPDMATGNQCWAPFECGFHGYCSRNDPVPEFPVSWLPRFPSARIEQLAEIGVIDLRDVPDAQLNDRQRRVKKHTLDGTVFFDADGAAADLEPYPLPAYFMDFETIQFAIPIWKGTRPYQQIPFQFSMHRLDTSGLLKHSAFLDLSGDDPREAFSAALIAACGSEGPVFAYNAGFEMGRIRELAECYPQMSAALLAINERVVDLLPIARERYYHPTQQGSWSIKKVLPAIVPDLSYDALDGVQDGGMAMEAFLEALHPGVSPERKAAIEQQLLAYCQLDTYAMVRLWQVFAGRTDLEL